MRTFEYFPTDLGMGGGGSKSVASINKPLFYLFVNAYHI